MSTNNFFKVQFETTSVKHFPNNVTVAEVTLFVNSDHITFCPIKTSAYARPSSNDVNKASEIIGERVALSKARRKALRLLNSRIKKACNNRLRELTTFLIDAGKIDNMLNFEDRYLTQY